jgi:hypothetical protein
MWLLKSPLGYDLSLLDFDQMIILIATSFLDGLKMDYKRDF